MNASIKSRLDKLSKAAGGDSTFIWVNIVDENGMVINCDKQQTGCPILPCAKPESCWVKRNHPGMKTINISSSDEGE